MAYCHTITGQHLRCKRVRRPVYEARFRVSVAVLASYSVRVTSTPGPASIQ